MQVEDFRKAQWAMENIKKIQDVLLAVRNCHYIKFGPEASIGLTTKDSGDILLDRLFKEIQADATDRLVTMLDPLLRDFDGFLSKLDPDYIERLYSDYNSPEAFYDLGKRYVKGCTVFVNTDSGVFVETVADSHDDALHLADVLNNSGTSIFHAWDEVIDKSPNTDGIRMDLIRDSIKWVPVYGKNPCVVYKDGIFDCVSSEEAFDLASVLNLMGKTSLEEWDIIVGWLEVNKPDIVNKYGYR
jgi:hypothetical protein